MRLVFLVCIALAVGVVVVCALVHDVLLLLHCRQSSLTLTCSALPCIVLPGQWHRLDNLGAIASMQVRPLLLILLHVICVDCWVLCCRALSSFVVFGKHLKNLFVFVLPARVDMVVDAGILLVRLAFVACSFGTICDDGCAPGAVWRVVVRSCARFRLLCMFVVLMDDVRLPM